MCILGCPSKTCFWIKKNPTKSCSIWSGLGRQYQSDFWQSSPKSCQNQTFFWDPSKQHPNTSVFGWIFLFTNMFCWDSLICTYLFSFWQNEREKNLNNVHLGQNWHIHWFLCRFFCWFFHQVLCWLFHWIFQRFYNLCPRQEFWPAGEKRIFKNCQAIAFAIQNAILAPRDSRDLGHPYTKWSKTQLPNSYRRSTIEREAPDIQALCLGKT